MDRCHRAALLAFLILFALEATPVEAQVCRGTPSGSGVAYEYGKYSAGESQGISGALVGKHSALGVGFAVRDFGDLSGQEVSLRFSVLVPAGKLLVCPGLGAVYQHETWDAPDVASLTSHYASLRAGLGVGFEQHAFGGLSVIPYVVAQYEFQLSVFDLSVANSDNDNVQLSGDTLSRAQFEYGLIGRYRFLYAGIAAHRSSETKGMRPDMTRWILGVTFSGNGRKRASR